jgi:flagellar M-ring protein FliF
MDFLNKAYAQVADVFKTMTPGSRIAVGLLLVAIVVALAYLFQYQVTSGEEYLLGGRPFYGDELTRAEAAFAKAGLSGSQIGDGNRIRIPRGQKEKYLAALAESSALPADFYKHLDEAAASDNPFSSSKSLEMRRWNAKQKELALIISRLKGISSATVQFDETASRGSLRAATQKRAMVAVQTLAGELDADQIKAIRNIVVGSYAGLNPEDVSINDITSGRTYTGVDGANGPQDSQYADYKQRFERDWKLKLEDQLSWIPNAIVNVNVQLDPELEDTTQQVTVDPKPVTVSSTEFQKDFSTTTREPGGRPGAVSNDVNGNRPLTVTAAAAAPQTQSNETRSEVANLPGHTITSKKKARLVPTYVTAAIQFPMSHVLKTWRQLHPAPAGQAAKEPDPAELDKIKSELKTKVEEIARNLLPPFATGTNPYPHITVTPYDDLKGEELPAPSMTAQAGSWLADNWRSLAMVGIGAFCLLMLRSMVKSTATAQPSSAAYSSAEAFDAPRLHEEPEEEEEPGQPEKMLRRRFEMTGPDLKQELQELVKEDPDAAATILRNWIGDAA